MSDYAAINRPKKADLAAAEEALRAALGGGKITITKGWRGRLEARRDNDE